VIEVSDLRAIEGEDRRDFDTDLPAHNSRERVLDRHAWIYVGRQDTSDWHPKDRRWAFDVWVCRHCRRVSEVWQHEPKAWRVRGGRHVAVKCDQAPGWWRRLIRR
jgi:hypothetical protein